MSAMTDDEQWFDERGNLMDPADIPPIIELDDDEFDGDDTEEYFGVAEVALHDPTIAEIREDLAAHDGQWRRYRFGSNSRASNRKQRLQVDVFQVVLDGRELWLRDPTGIEYPGDPSPDEPPHLAAGWGFNSHDQRRIAHVYRRALDGRSDADLSGRYAFDTEHRAYEVARCIQARRPHLGVRVHDFIDVRGRPRWAIHARIIGGPVPPSEVVEAAERVRRAKGITHPAGGAIDGRTPADIADLCIRLYEAGPGEWRAAFPRGRRRETMSRALQRNGYEIRWVGDRLEVRIPPEGARATPPRRGRPVSVDLQYLMDSCDRKPGVWHTHTYRYARTARDRVPTLVNRGYEVERDKNVLRVRAPWSP